jgi:hypothetical protein
MTPRRCPGKDAIIRFFEGRGSEKNRSEILSHVLACPECLAVFEAAEEIRSGSEAILRALDGADLGSPKARGRLRRQAADELRALRQKRRSGRRTAIRWAGIPAAGAALALLCALILVPRLSTPARDDVERNASPLELRLLQPRGGTGSLPLTFRWAPAPEARSYRLEIYDRTLEPVFRSGELGAEELTLAANTSLSLRAGETYFWKVAAFLKDDRTIESEFSKFVLQR